MRKPRVYVAGPITSSGSLHENLHNGIVVGEELRAAGFHPFIPHLYDFVKIVANYDVHWEDMLQMDENWISACDILVALPGESKGKEREIRLANKLAIPVVRLNKNTIFDEVNYNDFKPLLNGAIVNFLEAWEKRWNSVRPPEPSATPVTASSL